MNRRDQAVQSVRRRGRSTKAWLDMEAQSARFGGRVFNREVAKRLLPPHVFENLAAAMDRKAHINPEYADLIAEALKAWAVEHGATHFCHWFQPLTGAIAEKHDSFLHWKTTDSVIERLDGKELIQGEPDASSFPSGGLRTTFEARGYTGWDPSSSAFLWEGGDGLTLCVPSVFFSWTGAVLDYKIPLLRSDEKINEAVLRLCKHTNTEASRVYSTLGWEQEYFVVDRALRNLRPDLLIAGRTLMGAPPPKGQELEDHYFASVKDRILAYMQDFENSCIELGIPLKTRHNEVAPAQHEVAILYTRASNAVDYNILVMELMRQTAVKHELACLLHEKPFEGINGSGKHCNWSLATDTGLNLLDPSDGPASSLRFLVLLTAVLSGVHRHADLLRASIGSAGNDHRLGANEAPPAIISVFLGDELDGLLDELELAGKSGGKGKSAKYDLGIPVIPELRRDNTDRNRTSPFAFTGAKFEYRAVGSAQSCALPMTILNMAVAESLSEILDEIENKGSFSEAAVPVLRDWIKRSKPIRFSGNNYSPEWEEEAKKRKLPNVKKAVHAYEALTTKKAAKLFEGVLTAAELQARSEILTEIYAKSINVEANLMVEMFHTQVLPPALKTLTQVSEAYTAAKQAGGSGHLATFLSTLRETIDEGLEQASEMERLRANAESGTAFCDQVMPACVDLRKTIDKLEGMVDDNFWPLPKVRELLFLV